MSDFFKCLLLNGGSQANKKELESETTPFTFKSNGHRLRNYRIYGNTVNEESVGDLVTEGEHAGEYCVPITISGINMLDYSTVSIGYRVQWSTGNIFKDNSAIISDYISVNTGDCYSCNIELFIAGYDSDYNYIGVWNGNSFIKDYSHYYNNIKIPERCSFIRVFTYNATSTASTLNDRTMIVKGLTVPMIYEPYHSPVSYNLYIPEQIKKVGNEAEYIDFREQKQHRVRKNLWTEEMEAGGISNDGRLIDSTKRIRSDYIDVEPAKTYTFSSNLKIRLIYSYDKDNNRVDVISDSPLGNTSYTFTIPNNAVKIRIALMDRRNNVEYNITTNDFQWGQLEEGQTATDHEPYIDDTELNVNVILPAILTIDGTNIISVGTTVQPSKVYLQGNITEIETVSAQALQASPQTIDLQPLSLDVVEKNDLQLEESEQKENIVETTRDDENAE